MIEAHCTRLDIRIQEIRQIKPLPDTIDLDHDSPVAMFEQMSPIGRTCGPAEGIKFIMTKKPLLTPFFQWWGFVVIAVLFWGCAHHQPLPDEPYQLAFRVQGADASARQKWAPAFIVYGHSQKHNLIGRPSVSPNDGAGEKVYIDTENPVVYFLERTFQTDKATYTNFIYRVHFPGTPFSLIPFNISAGNNVGLIVVVTLDADKRPVLVTTVHTCGCYKAIVPTRYLPREALPVNWNEHPLKVYGEKLPPMLEFDGVPSPLIMAHLRPDVHRVMDLEIRARQFLSSPRFREVPMPMEPMAQLERLPFNGTTTSLFHKEGVLKGHVKGAVKPLETLFMSLISLDLFVGTDKAYSDTAKTGNPFYTSLKPWRRNDSDMWHFKRFLRYWGWRL